MDDLKFATELVRRLNALCEDDAAKAAVLALLDTKVEVGNSLDHHPTCSVSKGGVMGILGMMNGLAGGLICAGYSDVVEPSNFMGFYLQSNCEGSRLVGR